LNSTIIYYKNLGVIDTQSIIDFYSSIKDVIQWEEYGHLGKQSGVQFADNEDPFLSAVGKARFRDNKFHNLNEFYKGTVIEEIVEKYKLFRLRWMWVYPKSCYSIHCDFTPRIHIPLITNTENLFVFPNSIPFHLPKGSVFLVRTELLHTFMNCSNEPRLHLVGAVNF